MKRGPDRRRLQNRDRTDPCEPSDLPDERSRQDRSWLRWQVLLLAALGLFCLDALRTPGSDPAQLASPTAKTAGSAQAAAEPIDVEVLAALLERVNPSLDRHQLERIAAAVLRYSAKYDLEPELVTAVLLVESSARPWVQSPKGAVGLMQVMPHMMEPLGLAGNAATIESNIEAGCFILAGNIRRLGEEEGISSYFWGSDIRGLAYLEKVQATRAEVRRRLDS